MGQGLGQIAPAALIAVGVLILTGCTTNVDVPKTFTATLTVTGQAEQVEAGSGECVIDSIRVAPNDQIQIFGGSGAASVRSTLEVEAIVQLGRVGKRCHLSTAPALTEPVLPHPNSRTVAIPVLHVEKTPYRMLYLVQLSVSVLGGPFASTLSSPIWIDVEPNTLIGDCVRHIVIVVRVAGVRRIRQFRDLFDDRLCSRRTRIEHFLKRPHERATESAALRPNSRPPERRQRADHGEQH
jgi:hypothetical protein